MLRPVPSRIVPFKSAPKTLVLAALASLCVAAGSADNDPATPEDDAAYEAQDAIDAAKMLILEIAQAEQAKKVKKAAPPAEPEKVSPPLTILDLQELKETQTVERKPESEGELTASATLINLNPNANAWFVLSVRWPDQQKPLVYHLENPEPLTQKYSVDAVDGLVITGSDGRKTCDIWGKGMRDELKKTTLARNAFSPICDGMALVRSKTDGRKTTKEFVVEFLRDNIWGGEEIASFVKDKLLKDHFLISSDVTEGNGKTKAKSSGPAPAMIDPKFDQQLMDTTELEIDASYEEGRKIKFGQWYEHPKVPGVYVSGVIPDRIHSDVLASHKTLVGKLDPIEAKATVYLVAFDMDDFDMGFAMGTDHPRVDWSARALPESVDRSKPGPDGIKDWSPLATTGMVNPQIAKRVVATFTGGFKRDHGSFKWGKLAGVNSASHYGFIENGVIFSKLHPDLSTLFVTQDGTVELKTWSASDNAILGQVRHARQNGVAIIEPDPLTREPTPGALIKSWGAGNWSGSEDSKFRTLRAGVCMAEHEKKNYLIYGYFSSVTPSAMARVFQAYGCKYAMHLDMNALEHTYLAVYAGQGKAPVIEHLIRGMKVLDKAFDSTLIPRFVGFPDNRDFFYLTKKKAK